MAKLQGPLLSESAHGTIGGALTYSSRTTAKQVRYQRKQRDVITAARTTQRGYFQTAAGWWGAMTSGEQEGFDGYDEREE